MEDSELLYVHRKLDNMDIYWVNNRKDRVEELATTYRVEGRIPEIRHPENGQIEKASYTIENGVTHVPLHFEPNDAVFEVFSKNAKANSYIVPEPEITKLVTLNGSQGHQKFSLTLERWSLAEVVVNGKSMGIVWKKPFKLDITGALVEGENELEIRVTDLWVNRLIGDQQPGAEVSTYTTMPFYRADSHLKPSGLPGPVTIVSEKYNQSKEILRP